MNLFKNFSLATRFLTIFPLTKLMFKKDSNKEEQISNKDFASSMVFFPLVGLGIGFFLVIFQKIFFYATFPPLLSSALILVIWIWMSGGLHLDGFVDSVDGFSGGKDKEEILKIMQDSTVGAKGILALFSLLLLKFILLVESFPLSQETILLFTPVISRWSMVMAAYLGKPAHSQNSMGKLFMDYLSWKEFILATLIMVGIGFLAFNHYFFYFILMAITIVWLILWYSQQKIGGINGDIIGAINEIVELFILLTYYILTLDKCIF